MPEELDSLAICLRLVINMYVYITWPFDCSWVIFSDAEHNVCVRVVLRHLIAART